MEASNGIKGSSVETVAVAETVFESFFDASAGTWSLRRVPAARPRPRLAPSGTFKRVVVRKRAVPTANAA